VSTIAVLDASVVFEACVSELPRGEDCRKLLAATDAYVPSLIYSEVAHSLRKFEVFTKVEMEDTYRVLVAMPWVSVDYRHYSSRVWPLRHDLSLYDATYVALAQLLGAPLFTLDMKMAKTATRYCEVVVPGE
jgi:predicted nucleic acid-binding protein